MAQYKKYFEQKSLPAGTKKRPGQAGYDGNKELRTKVVQVAYSPTEYINLEHQYEVSSHSSIASFVREKSLSKSVQAVTKRQMNVETVAELYQLVKATDISQTGRMGNNLNQIAKKLNNNEGFANFKEKMLEELKLMRDINQKAQALLLKIVGGKQ